MHISYLNCEIELTEKVATLEGGKKQTIVLHSELEELILNMCNSGKVRFDYPVVIPSLSDAVVTCRIWDDNNRHVVAIGESTEATRTSSIADSYPTTTAANRAFDRAAIRFLGLGKVYSDLEIAPDGPKRYESDRLTDAQPSTTQAESVSSANPDSVIASTNPNNAPDVSNATPAPAKQTVSTNTQVTDNAQKQNTDVDGSVVISIGKYANKNKTVAEIYELDPSWLKYITTLAPKKDEMRMQVESAKRFLEKKESK